MDRIHARKLYTDAEVYANQVIVAERGTILDIVPADATGEPSTMMVESIAPAFIDLQVNGGASLNFSETANLSAARDIDRSCQAVGTGYVLPTVISSPLDNILHCIDAVRRYRELDPDGGVLGMHLEGPFIAPVRSGAHAHGFIRQPSNEELLQIIRAGKGVIKLMTIAPELFTDEQLDLLLDAGITLAAGHTNANYAIACRAFDRGIKLVTHLYNAMTPFLARMPGVVGAVFDCPEVAAPIILDGIHSDYCAARMAHKIKGEKLFLVSDALFVGRKVSSYSWGDFNAHLQDGQYLTYDGHLAGSTISLGEAVANAVTHLQASIAEAVDMVTRRPALAIGMENNVGSIRRGYSAVFTIFDDTLRSFKVLRV
jgi:N-acetylglucosamine-6-phosphate deacetylase